jgi:signal peptidase I
MRRRILAVGLLAILAALLVAAARMLVAYEISDRSMEPALRHGDWVLGTRRSRLLRRGNVIVFAHPMRPGFDMVKRVAAVAGEEVGRVSLGRGEVWALGDNPDAGSVDSRTLGPIRREWVRARLLLRYRPGSPSRIR